VKEYFLFIDTEASGLPKNWSLPYNSPGNWPYCVQISWVIYNNDQNEIKTQNHYIKDNGFAIEASATKIHGITRKFLDANGENRKNILKLLADDLTTFDPLIVGHFMQFDAHILGADFFREGLENPLKKEAAFCTMLGSINLIKNPSVKFLRLEQLYKTLFDKNLEDHHNAITDARATALCFFELMKRGEITEESIARQQIENVKKVPGRQYGCAVPMLIVVVLTFLIFYL
jgi:DNA polymerase-3 subunit epsilon